MKLIGIKYVGKKSRPQPDTVLGTSRVWPDTTHVEWVPEKDVPAYLKHPDVWAADGEKQTKNMDDLLGLDAAPVKKEERVEEDLLAAPLVQLDAMDKSSLKQFAQMHFNQSFHPNTNESTMRNKIRNWMNSPTTG